MIIMQYIAIGLIFLLGIIDSFIMVFLFLYPHTITQSLSIHLLIYVLIHVLCRKYLNNIFSGIPNYLALFLPGLGGIMVSLLHLSLAYFQRDSVILDDYERYISFINLMDGPEKVDYEEEMRTLSFMDQMNLLDSSGKKNLIMDLSLNQYDSKINLLQRGLSDSDLEVQHYSAATLNLIENEYTRTINKVREQFNLYNETEALKQLINVYKRYIESGLLSGEVLLVFNKEYIETLNKLLHRKKETPEILDELVKAYVRSGNFERARTVNLLLLKNYPNRSEGIGNEIQIAFEQKRFTEIHRLLTEYEGKNISLSPRVQSLQSFGWKRGN